MLRLPGTVKSMRAAQAIKIGPQNIAFQIL